MLYGEKSTTSTTAIVTVVSSQEAKDGKRCLITKVCAIMRRSGGSHSMLGNSKIFMTLTSC